MKPRTRVIRLIAIATLTPVLFLLSCQSSLIYHPRDYQQADIERLEAVGGERLTFQSDGHPQTAFYIPARKPTPDGPIWIVFSGNAALALDWTWILPQWDDRFAYLLVDYPGYGDCEGAPNPSSIAQSGTAALDRLSKRLKTDPKALPSRSWVLGQSLGCAAALQLAGAHQSRGAILISPFTTMTEMARQVVGWPLCHLNRHRFDNRQELTGFLKQGGSATLFHGDQDRIIPIGMSRELAEMEPAAVRLIPVPGAGHNDILGFAHRAIGQAMKDMAFGAE